MDINSLAGGVLRNGDRRLMCCRYEVQAMRRIDLIGRENWDYLWSVANDGWVRGNFSGARKSEFSKKD
jgi:hypothetical protein